MAVRAKDVGSDYITPREYQIELCHRATASDAIILLPPGSGKTYIAILLMRKMAGKLGSGKKTAVYIVSGDVLVEQHHSKINLNTPLTVGMWTDPVDEKQADTFRKFFDESDVVVMTSYHFHEALVHALVTLDQVALLVLDECHHCLGESDPYRLIAEYFKKAKADKVDVRLLGLTGCGISKKVAPKEVRATFAQLESAVGAPIVTANVMLTNTRHNLRPVQVLQLANSEQAKVDLSPLVKLEFFIRNNGDFSEVMDADPRNDILNRVNKAHYVTTDCGIYGGYQYAKIAEKHFTKYIESQYVSPAMLAVISTSKYAFKDFCMPWDAELENITTWEAMKPFLSACVVKVIELIEAFYKYKTNSDKNMTCLVFVDKRTTAIAIATVLRMLASQNPRFAFLKADYAIGSAQNNEKLEQSVAQKSDQRFNEAIQNIRNGTRNVLVTTSILEEGVDIRNCNIVIRLGCPQTYSSFALMRGRARSHPSMFAIVMDPKNELEVRNLQNFYDIDKILFDKMSCSQNAVTVDIPFTMHSDYLEKEFVTEAGASLKLSNAISVLNRYAARLPSDVFTRLVLDIHSHREGHGYRSIMFFPMNCPIKQIVHSKIMATIRLSQMSVAFEACKILHANGEIDDNLYPVIKEKVSTTQDLADEFGDLAPNLPHVTGSSKKRRLYSRIVAVTLNKVLPAPNEEFYVYAIDMDMVEPISEASNPKKRKIINPKDMNHSFGYISTKRIPVIPSFPIYQRQGKMQVRFIQLPRKFSLDEKQLKMVKDFHQYIVEEILNMRHNMEFQPENSPFSILLVPLKLENNVYNLDFDVLTNTVKGFPTPPTEEERKKFVYEPTKYQDAVVKPWYRYAESVSFYIGEVNTNLYPHSAFADDKYKTFDHYFEHKYNLTIYNKEQQLLDVDNASVRMNLLLPRVVQTRSIRRGADPSQKQFMIPELVVIHPMPATFWVMVIGLPTILFRMNCLLLADEFRARVAADALNLTVETPEDHHWDDLSYSVSLNNCPTTVRNINQLKMVNDIIMEEEAAAVEDQPSPDPEFVIDVWDPTLGEQYVHSPLNPIDEPENRSNVSHENEFFDDDMSDDDEKWRNTPVHINKFDTSWDPTPANVDVGPTIASGWDDETVPEARMMVDAQVSLSSAAGIDATSLLLDLEKITPGQSIYKRSSHVKYSDPVEAMDEKDELDKQARAEIKESEEILDCCLAEEVEGDISEAIMVGDDSDVEPDDVADDKNDDNIRFTVPKSKFADADASESSCTDKPEQDVITSEPIMAGEVKRPYFCMLPLEERVTAPPLFNYMQHWFQKDKSAENPYGVAPTLLLQALTTSSASDGFNLERLETIGDSFLKLSVTNFFYHNNPCDNEGALSSQRSKEVSNSNLFKLGRAKRIASLMECCKFEPTVNWLPPGFIAIGSNFDSRIIDSDETEKVEGTGWETPADASTNADGIETIVLAEQRTDDIFPYPYNNLTQQNISDKAIADCVEALIGAHLIQLGSQKALEFMRYMDLKVLCERPPISSPIDVNIPDISRAVREKYVLRLYENHRFHLLEETICYKFRDPAFLIQAFTHNSFHYNRVTGCYQRLEFLGDAVLDFLITRYLFEHKLQYNPGILTDLRSALVNNVIFASLAVRNGMNRFLLLHAPLLNSLIEKFVKLVESKGDEVNFNDDLFMVTEDESNDDAKDIEVPKALGDVFESLAGAVYLDSGMDLTVVWRVFYKIMQKSIEKCCKDPPQSPIRELFEMRNHTVRFAQVDLNAKENTVSVTVEIDNGKLRFTGTGRSHRIAKTTAAKKALRYLHSLDGARR